MTSARNFTILFIFFLMLCPLAAMAGPGGLKDSNQVFQPLLDWLVEAGVKREQALKWFNSPQVKFEARLLSSMLSHREATRDYQGFLDANKIKRAREFKARYAAALERAQQDSQVPAEVIVAILLIESDLGGYSGKTITFNALASQAVLDNNAARRILASVWPAKQKDYLQTKAALERFAKRAEWARGELLALIRLAEQWQVPLLGIKGSPAGALGWCQFMPTSIERWGADGSGDGMVDVSNPLDAIASIGRYLHEHGWRANMTEEEKIQVVLTYNKSTPYAQAVLAVAEKL